MSKKKTEKFQQKQITEKKDKEKKKRKEIRNRKNYILLSVSCTIRIKCTYIMAIPVVEFSREGYKTRNIFG